MLVDVGTGFFVNKSSDDAIDYLKRKQKMLQENIQQVQTVLATKKKSLETIQTVKYDKETALSQQQKQEQAKQAGIAAK